MERPGLRVLAAAGVVVAAVLGLTGTYLGTLEGLGFLRDAPVPQLTILALLGFLWLWAKSAGINLLRPRDAYLADLRRQTRQRMQDKGGGPVSELEADEQVQRWEVAMDFLGRAQRGLPRDPEDLTDLRRSDIVGGLNSIKEAPQGQHLGTQLERIMSPSLADGMQHMSRRTLKASRSFIANLRRTLRPWDVAAGLKLSRFDHPLRP